MTINKKSILIVIVGIISSIIFIRILKSDERSTPNILSIVGTFASLIGLGITYVQIKDIKSISESNKKVSLETKDSINNVLLLSDSVNVSYIINETQGYLSNKETINLALLRMKDLKRYLIHFKSLSKFTGKTKRFMLNQMIIDLTNDTRNLSDKLNPQIDTSQINISEMNNNLENILDFVLEIEQITKNENLK